MSDEVILITGGGRGIGAATALLAAERGYRVCVNYRTDEAAAAGVVERIEAAGGSALAVRADVSRSTEVERLFRTVDEEFGPLTALVNNAGTLEKQGRLDELDEDRLARIWAANITGPFLCAGAAVRRMSTRYGGRGGAIVNVSSAASRLGSPNEYVDYAASKGALDSMTTGLALEVAAEGIRVNAVRPGLIHTDIHALGGEPARVDRVGPLLPMGRGGRPEEVAEGILYLLSPGASYVTGAFLDLAGGR
ncbi:NAD(P)-dependent dehydrogenase (short-subunit alcohol dehydrogenase family) [Kitasatospora gansuensis]|uniref:NAD(P)-dependent dehydrogenase (Short-subunit alcohol dehydrogenase family) n=1 Tax=Kitasatospora gansuensis TaxID=258050 RepID=A0A7W7SCQ2_9ACTN|nr:SDR family oxidoreductase [Kitasatospora gansuensis]MBB4948051.1 NAD(P)-dependent dehydrogenase (short-subunit alcohol dehydrogenase family) [Kitasatospora gansuensis]